MLPFKLSRRAILAASVLPHDSIEMCGLRQEGPRSPLTGDGFDIDISCNPQQDSRLHDKRPAAIPGADLASTPNREHGERHARRFPRNSIKAEQRPAGIAEVIEAGTDTKAFFPRLYIMRRGGRQKRRRNRLDLQQRYVSIERVTLAGRYDACFKKPALAVTIDKANHDWIALDAVRGRE